MTFSADLNKIMQKVRTRERLLYSRCEAHAFHSIRFGSTVTGAPGQPVDKGDLLRSWTLKRKANRQSEMKSSLVSAPIIEHNRRGARLRSKVGGFHSVKLTRAGWPRIVAYELGRIKAGATDVPRIPQARTGPARDARGRFRSRGSSLQIDG